MCRMLLAVGKEEFSKVLLSSLFEAMKLMALDQTTIHERNEQEGLGTWLHKDGWGIAYLTKEPAANESAINKSQNSSLQNKFHLIKSIKPFYPDSETKKAATISTNFALLHIRLAGMGSASLENTHPFHAKTEQGEEIVFCHNGTIREPIVFNQKYQAKGESDTEKLLYAILTNYSQTANFPLSIKKTFASLKQRWDLNVILSTPTRSYVFSQSAKYPRYMQMWIGRKKDSLIISSERISPEKIPAISGYSWEELPKGKVLIIQHKKMNIQFGEI